MWASGAPQGAQGSPPGLETEKGMDGQKLKRQHCNVLIAYCADQSLPSATSDCHLGPVEPREVINSSHDQSHMQETGQFLPPFGGEQPGLLHACRPSPKLPRLP